MELLSPAKINLYLQVKARRPDGYHELESLMCPISLSDSLILSFKSQRMLVRCDHQEVPSDETNLAWRAAELFFQTLKSADKVEVSIVKNIPVAAGLGGGSSNAASVLLGLNHYYGKPFDKIKLAEMGLSLGADVPFFIYQKPAIARGIGEKLNIIKGLTPFYVLLISFDFKVSTAEVYKNLNLGLTKCKKINNSLFFGKQRFDVNRHLCNDLETVTASKFPEIIAAKKALMDHGARGALMSGSGPTVFGLFSDADIAGKAKRFLSEKKGWKPYLVDMIL
jgi:4-diphosphocytidyl-2-C-methyl-D-erythritol kinase